MRALGHNPTMKEVRQIISEVDNDGSSTIDFFEFVTMIETRALIDIEAEKQKLVESFKYAKIQCNLQIKIM